MLKDISERKRAEEKIPHAGVERSRGGVHFHPQGRFMDFNDALMRILDLKPQRVAARRDIQRCS